MTSIEIEEAAAVWLAKRDRNEWSDAGEAELMRWLQASTAHRVAFIRLESMWRKANRLKALGAGVRRGVVPAAGAWRLAPFLRISHPAAAIEREYRPRSFTRLRALAASILLAAALGMSWYLWPSAPTYSTPIGGVEALALSDGSTVTLNTNTEIRVAVTNNERRIDLQHGEAFFDVVKDPARPFVVMAGGQRVVAVGTKFSVRRAGSDDDDVRVVVTEGRVRVGPAAAAAFSAVEVTAGSIARTGGAGVLIEDNPRRPVDEYLSWRSGYLVFRETALADAVAEFNRYNTTQLAIEDPAVAAIRIGGSFRSTNVDAFVRLLEDGLAVPIRVERRGEQIVLSVR